MPDTDCHSGDASAPHPDRLLLLGRQDCEYQAQIRVREGGTGPMSPLHVDQDRLLLCGCQNCENQAQTALERASHCACASCNHGRVPGHQGGLGADALLHMRCTLASRHGCRAVCGLQHSVGLEGPVRFFCEKELR